MGVMSNPLQTKFIINSEISNNVDMNLEPILEVEKENTMMTEKISNEVMSTIYDRFGAIKKLNSR